MIYVVIDKVTLSEIYRYQADAAIEWEGMEFNKYNHNLLVMQDEQLSKPVGKLFSKLAYLRRFTQEERINIRTAAEQNRQLSDYLSMLELAEEINTEDIDTVEAVTMLEQIGLLSVGRAYEVLYG